MPCTQGDGQPLKWLYDVHPPPYPETMRIGLLHPGEMGAALAGVLVAHGHEVLWVPEGRSAESAHRAARHGLTEAPSVCALAESCTVILSICPPHAAEAVAGEVGPRYDGVFVDLNAIAPDTVRRIGDSLPHVVDGGIIGAPPRDGGGPHIFLSGSGAETVRELFAGASLTASVVSQAVGAASAVKMTYAAWTKGTAALLLAINAAAHAYGVEDALHEAWRGASSQMEEQSLSAAVAALAKGWRWTGEMREIAATFETVGLPGGFHRAAASVYERVERSAPPTSDPDRVLKRVVEQLFAR